MAVLYTARKWKEHAARFSMIQAAQTIKQILAAAAGELQRAGISEARRDASLLLGFALDCDRAYLLTHAEEALPFDTLTRFQTFIRRRARHEPLQYITGRQAFYNLDFEVTPAVLIPRPETEILIEAALKLTDTQTDGAPFICDVGTGSGCIIISLLYELKHARGTALDISIDALAVARRNAVRAAVDNRLAFIASDVFAALDNERTKFSMIVSNPPYIAADEIETLMAEVRDYEPRHALTPRHDANRDGLGVISRLLNDAPQFLRVNGTLLFEIGFGQQAAIENLIDRRVWTTHEVVKDLQGIARTFVLHLT
ncbi:MAG: peptide chain release factor N(5)-glutamine methyltransferase [Pyrinomonadaceae bacterium MAG19_C2-C3]|nr:peptide chain release factor N(5)-glutamine methyltransferase [Pyrinomonadaceae bacterium MAG19_C2-C3]